MTDFLSLMSAPFVACLILTGIHAYLGLHVIQRGVIFVDLALAQVAALGATCGFLLGFGLHSTESYFISLTATLIAAAIFAAVRNDKGTVPQEAFIGIVYAVAAAASILILNFTPEGGEELKAVMVGHLLFVDWAEITKIALVYAAVGIFHFFTRHIFFAISADVNKAKDSGINVRRWDFLFYATFGIVVTSSVEIAGVLLVFSFLIVPAVCGAIVTKNTNQRLIIGWVTGFITSCAGISASYFLDLPTGPAIVCAFGICLLICMGITKIQHR